MSLRWQPGNSGQRVTIEFAVTLTGDRDAGRMTQCLSGGVELFCPTCAQEVVTLQTPRETSHQRTGPGVACPQQEHLPGMAVGRSRLGVEVVTVVPDRDQTQVANRRERGRAGADRDRHRTPRKRQETAVALGRAGVGAKHRVGVRAGQRGEPGREPVDVPPVGQAHHRSPAARRRGQGGLRESLGPVLARHGRPHRPDGAAAG